MMEGVSVVAFAFCHLLGFKLMLRFKNNGSQKLYRTEASIPHLQQALSRPIKIHEGLNTVNNS